MGPDTKHQKSRAVISLVILLVFLGLGGLGGGLAMFIDPSGQGMGLPSGLLQGVPISNYILPGIFLVSVMGVHSVVIAWGIWKGLPWTWLLAVAQSVMLILWICFQILLWGNPIGIQIFYLLLGVIMLGLCFLPGVRQRF